MDELAMMAINTAVQSEFPSIFDSDVPPDPQVDDNNNNDISTPSQPRPRTVRILLGSKMRRREMEIDVSGALFIYCMFLIFNSVYEWPKLSLVIAVTAAGILDGCSSEVADVPSGLGIGKHVSEAPAPYDPVSTPASKGPTPGEYD